MIIGETYKEVGMIGNQKLAQEDKSATFRQNNHNELHYINKIVLFSTDLFPHIWKNISTNYILTCSDFQPHFSVRQDLSKLHYPVPYVNTSDAMSAHQAFLQNRFQN